MRSTSSNAKRSPASLKRKREREKLKAMGIQRPRDKIVREVGHSRSHPRDPGALGKPQAGARRRPHQVPDDGRRDAQDHSMVIDADTAELIVQEFGTRRSRVAGSRRRIRVHR